MSCPNTTAIGAYVLGSLDTGERLHLERHLSHCESCNDALRQFANLPGLLHAATLEEVTAVPAAKPSRTRRRALIAVAATVLVVGAGVLAGRELAADPAPQAQPSVSWSATDGLGGIDATATLSNQSWGTAIQLQLKDLKPRQLCKLVVHARSGASETTGWWTTNYSNAAEVPASTSIALPDIDHIDVVTAAGAVLASLTASTR